MGGVGTRKEDQPQTLRYIINAYQLHGKNKQKQIVMNRTCVFQLLLLLLFVLFWDYFLNQH